jgi:hypothetical protein
MKIIDKEFLICNLILILMNVEIARYAIFYTERMTPDMWFLSSVAWTYSIVYFIIFFDGRKGEQ